MHNRTGASCYILYSYNIHSKFDENFGGRGATIDFSFHRGRFENVIFKSNRGPVIRVSV